MKVRLVYDNLCADSGEASIEFCNEAATYKRVEAGQEWNSITAMRNGSKFFSTRVYYLATLSQGSVTYTRHPVGSHETEQ